MSLGASWIPGGYFPPLLGKVAVNASYDVCALPLPAARISFVRPTGHEAFLSLPGLPAVCPSAHRCGPRRLPPAAEPPPRDFPLRPLLLRSHRPTGLLRRQFPFCASAPSRSPTAQSPSLPVPPAARPPQAPFSLQPLDKVLSAESGPGSQGRSWGCGLPTGG